MEQELAQAIELISAQLGIAVEMIFGTFASAQSIVGTIDIIAMSVTLVGTYLIWKRVRKTMVTAMDDSAQQDEKNVAFWFPIVVAFIAAMLLDVITDAFGNALLKIACPEYSAMKEMIELAMR